MAARKLMKGLRPYRRDMRLMDYWKSVAPAIQILTDVLYIAWVVALGV
jgi:hypothetical protein